ncbi:4'-phosphopantetheine phosphatase [Musca vetustissima]|uniref:4'-phosphopantetheine phosphatase n=1 Tax=Musca vetustissima TaxID=27455 RepID=UPI002AB6CE01|nr:4'-phosphopantetheine phosphatase [Musca vetustissima]
MCEWRCNALVKDNNKYNPDTLDLNTDEEAARYWFPCFQDMIKKFARQAENSQKSHDDTATERAQQFRETYLRKLEEYRCQTKENAENNKTLGIRELLELIDKHLRLYGFPDPWLEQKKTENTAALELFAERIGEIDAIADSRQRWTELVKGVLAGNMFDWGAQAVTNIILNDKTFGLHAALERIQKRPWLMDDLDKWLERLHNGGAIHKCAAVFVDNCGVDVVLGILPFARELLKRGTRVILCANNEPSLNDVTISELSTILDSCSCHCPTIKEARSSKLLTIQGTGQKGPCLDMRTLPQDLCNALNETDLLVIEGMGRALHTNLYASFNCDTLKLAVVKNKWLAQRLGGDTFSVICRYEPLLPLS